MDQQQQYVGLDVSLETTAICVIDDKGAVVWRGKCASTGIDHRRGADNTPRRRSGSGSKPVSSRIG